MKKLHEEKQIFLETIILLDERGTRRPMRKLLLLNTI